jgi:hypothetical protein
MPESVSLVKANPLLPAEDYEGLRKQGLKNIEKLGSAIWTEYNFSDPGITLLEAVCYAITDLAYRSGFAVKDLLAPEKLTEDTWKQIFYTARQILHNNPLTINDYRKIIIDVRGVRNAWIEPAKDYEVPVWIDYSFSEVRKEHDCCCEEPEEKTCYGKLQLNGSVSDDPKKTVTSKIVEFEGLYNVLVEYEEDVLEDETRASVRQQVKDRLSRYRNLCEDVLTVNAVEYEDFGIGASVVLEEYADPDQVLAQIFFVIYKYFTPSIPFHTIQQMLDKGYAVDEIFEGPALRHGFIDTEELEKTDLFRDIRLSDIISEVADIRGIKAITYLHLPLDAGKPDDKQYFDLWVKLLEEERKIARIQPGKSKIMFCKERDFITYYMGRPEDRKPDRMLKLFNDLKLLERKYKLEGHQRDYPVPTGENMELEDYFPVTYSLPMCYGVSPYAGLPSDADETRKVQALQLKGYLLFFEQLLSDHLVQLNHLRDIFSFDDSVEHTSYARVLKEFDGIRELLIDHEDRGPGHFEQVLHDFSHVLQQLVEPAPLFYKRRNRFLDHMLARFSEDLKEYETLSRWLTPYKVEQRMIRDKIHVLKDGEYYRISSQRGKGYDYSRADFWDTLNVSGAERRVARLLGFSNVSRRSLYPDYLVVEPLMDTDPKTKTPYRRTTKKGEPLNMIKLLDPENRQEVLLTSVEVKEGCCTELLAAEILKHADSRRYYKFHDEQKQRSRKSAGEVGTFWFELWDGTDTETAVLLASSAPFSKREQREQAYKALQKALRAINENEGMHLVEHILLRPKFDAVLDPEGNDIEVKFPDICLDLCDLNKGLNEGTAVPPYRKKLHRIPSDKCYDQLPWVLEYFRFNPATKAYDQSILFQETFPDGSESKPLKFRRYTQMTARVHDLQEYGAERINYVLLSNEAEGDELRYSFMIMGDKGRILAQSPFLFRKRTRSQIEAGTKIPDDIEVEIEQLIRYFNFELDLYCAENPCDHNEDPYSFRCTVVLPCWPKRLRDTTFRNLVEKTIQTQFPAHIHVRVVWLGILEMQRFEKVYYDWMKEMSITEMPNYESVNPLVEVLNTLVPCGHCEDEC